jgi:hypothetical protein
MKFTRINQFINPFNDNAVQRRNESSNPQQSREALTLERSEGRMSLSRTISALLI